MLADLRQCVMRRTARTKPVRTIFKVLLKDRFHYQKGCHLNHPITDRWNPQRTHLTVYFGNQLPTYRGRLISLGAQSLLDICHKTLHAFFAGLDRCKANSVHSRGAFISTHLFPRCFQCIITADLVIKRIKTKLRLLLGLLAQLLSQGRKTRRQSLFGFSCLFRSRFFQSVFLPSYINVPSAGSLGSIPFPGLLSYYEPLRLPTRPPAGYLFPTGVDITPSPGRVSQVPPPIFPRALSPITPGGPMAACAHFFTTGFGLHHNPGGWSRSTCVTRPNRVHLRYGSRVRSAGLRRHRLLRAPPTPLPAERAICRVPTLQGTRSARLILAHRIFTDLHGFYV